MVFGKGAQGSGFPKHRVAKVLRREGCCGKQPRIKVEGAFIQLSAEGQPTRQVFLGLTSSEFVLVKQEIPRSYTPAHVSGDPEVCDLVLELLLPLPVLKFFVLDDRARRFTVCTCFEKMLRFEMCQLDSKFEESWRGWKRALIQISGDTGSYGYKSWLSTYVLDMEQYNPAIEKTLMKHHQRYLYVHHPFSFQQVCCVGVQTTVQPESEGLGDEIETGNDVSDSDFSSSEKLIIPLGERPSKRLNMFSCQHALSALTTVELGGMTVIPTRSCSWTDASTYEKETCEDRTEVLKLLKKDKPRSGGIIEESHRLLHLDSDNESEDDLDEYIQEFETKKSVGRSGWDLWRKARGLVLKTTKCSIADVFHQAVFKVMTASGLPKSIANLDPAEVASALTAISKRLIMSLRPADIELYSISKGRQLPERLAVALEYGYNISKMVATEILRRQSVLERAFVIKRFIGVCTELLFHQRDFLSLASILNGLTLLPVYRLDNTWVTLFVDEPVAFRKFMCIVKILSTKGNFSAYTGRVRTLQGKGIPFIPWFGHFLQHCKNSRCNADRSVERKGTGNGTRRTRINTLFHFKSKRKGKRKTPAIHTMKSNQKHKPEEDKIHIDLSKPAQKTRRNEENNDTRDHGSNKVNSGKLKSILVVNRKHRKSKLRSAFKGTRKTVRFNVEGEEKNDEQTFENIMKNIAKTTRFSRRKQDKPKSGYNSPGSTKDEGTRENDRWSSGNKLRDFDHKTLRAIERYSCRQSQEIINSALQGIADGASKQGDWSEESSEETDDDKESMSSDSAFSEDEDDFNLVTTRQATQSRHVSDEPASIPSISSDQRRMSYVPAVIQGRRKSLFEEAVKEADGKPDDNVVFEELKAKKLNTMKKRGSIALALLETDEDTAKNTRGKYISKHVKWAMQNESNNSKQNGKHKKRNVKRGGAMSLRTGASSETGTGVKHHRVSGSLSLETQCNSSDNCALCAMLKCIYMSDKRKQILHFKTDAMKIRPRSKKSVEDYIQNGSKVNSLLAEYDILQISLQLD